jgi:hypothetical protein
MKPFAYLLLLAIVILVFSSGCLSSTPQKKVVTTTVVTTTPVANTPLPSTPGPTTTAVQITPAVTVTYDDVIIIPEPEITTPNLRVLKYNEARPEVGRLIITGIAKNDGKTSVPHAEVQIKFYDANNNVITSAKDTTDNFEPGGTWEFTIVYPGPDSRKVYSYKVSIASVSQ